MEIGHYGSYSTDLIMRNNCWTRKETSFSFLPFQVVNCRWLVGQFIYLLGLHLTAALELLTIILFKQLFVPHNLKNNQELKFFIKPVFVGYTLSLSQQIYFRKPSYRSCRIVQNREGMPFESNQTYCGRWIKTDQPN